MRQKSISLIVPVQGLVGLLHSFSIRVNFEDFTLGRARPLLKKQQRMNTAKAQRHEMIPMLIQRLCSLQQGRDIVIF